MNASKNPAPLIVLQALCTVWILLCLLPTFPARAASEPPSASLFDRSLEELLQLEISLASKSTQKVTDAAAAVFVLTDEDIRRSGAGHIAEVLRLVPGVNVGRIDSSRWALSMRGLQTQLSANLLVLLDGRTIYSPIFSGVFWDEQEIMLEDIERIEVIRGPGASLWGANAVNGVINIISKHTRDTQGLLASATFGDEDQVITSVRQGFQKDNLSMRVYARWAERDSFVDAGSRRTGDDWESGRIGFRSDWDPTKNDRVMFRGDWYAADIDKRGRLNILNPARVKSIDGEAELRGGSLQARWAHRLSDTSEIMLQGFYMRSERDDDFATDNHVEVCDLELQHSLLAGRRHRLVWGAGFRHVRDHHRKGRFTWYEPSSDNTQVFSCFIQDEISLVPDRLRLVAGSRLEHNDFTAFEVQPTLRLIWFPTARQQVWAAVSRAVRTPSRADEDGRTIAAAFPAGSERPLAESIISGRGHKSETVLSFEAGYRHLVTDRLSLDVSFFYNRYEDIPTFPVSGGRPYPAYDHRHLRLIVPLTSSTGLDGTTHGFELTASWQPLDRWKLTAAYSFLHMALNGPNNHSVEKRTPKHQANLRSLVNLTGRLELDTALYFVDRVPDYGISSYVRCDVRLGWQPVHCLDISLVGQNLFDDRHPEFKGLLYAVETEVERSWFVRVTWKF